MAKTTLKLLVLEDDPQYSSMYAKSLSPLALNISSTQNITSAYKIFTKLHPNIVLSNIHLCQKNNFEFLKHIVKTDPLTKIILTAKHTPKLSNRNQKQEFSFLNNKISLDKWNHFISPLRG